MLPDPEDLADQLLDITGQRRPPTDVRTILGKWSQLSVVETELDGDGFFIDLGEVGGEIFVKKDKQETRKRFTLAHELGHFLLRQHIREQPKEQVIETWCNRFATQLLLPRSMVSRHLKAGGLKDFTKRLQEGPNIFQVSEKAFYLRTSRLFPVSILNVLVSHAKVAVVDEYRSRDLESILGSAEKLLTEEVMTFVVELAETGIVQQQQFKQARAIWLARGIYRTRKIQKLLLVQLERR
jgi:Zn-dependent peptidase ImmA (M78 family)